MDNDADELKIKFWACCNNVNWTAQKYFIQTCRLRLPVVQGDAEGSFIPFYEHFHQCWEQFIQDSQHKKMSEHNMGALYHQYDWNFHNMIGYILRLDGSVQDDNCKPTM